MARRHQEKQVSSTARIQTSSSVMRRRASKHESSLHKGNGQQTDTLSIYGAREHNLRNLDLSLPLHQLVVITGVSGSGKSSLAFDTLYAEGQYRYMQSFSSYARSYMGELRRPDVDRIEGLNPVIAIQQKTTSHHPRSTVGTLTEIYDFLRVLYARIGEAYSYLSGLRMVKQTQDQIARRLRQQFGDQFIYVLAPVVRARKGHYRPLFEKLRSQGYTKARINGRIERLRAGMQLDRFKTHDIELLVDAWTLSPKPDPRATQSLTIAFQEGKGGILVLDKDGKAYPFSTALMDPTTGLSYEEPAPNTFSFSTPQGACPQCKGLGVEHELDEAKLIPQPALSLEEGGLPLLGIHGKRKHTRYTFQLLAQWLKKAGYGLDTPIKDLPKSLRKRLLYGEGERETILSRTLRDDFAGETLPDEPEALLEKCGLIYLLLRHSFYASFVLKRMGLYTRARACAACKGARLAKHALHFKIQGANIADITNWRIDAFAHWIKALPTKLSERHQTIATPILKEISSRVALLEQLGLTYLSLSRPLSTLSGGEAQRIRLATQLGTQLVDVLYILDEPSIGLHARDNANLIAALRQLRDQGNTIVVVEHDKEMMEAADYLIDMGPGAGREGGEVVAAGPPHILTQNNKGRTAAYLSGEKRFHKIAPNKRPLRANASLTLTGATGHNLKDLSVRLPLENLIVVTGVSGSGKSTLIHQTLVPILQGRLHKLGAAPLPYADLVGSEVLDKIIEITQAPIGRTPRSSPATYTGVFTDIRNLYAQLPESKVRAYTPSRFSFNIKGGRCEHCGGGGMRLIEMEFLSDMHIECEQCRSRRYNEETLEVRYKGASIADVLNMSVREACEFFAEHPQILRKISVINEVGLGYISLGQHATTLSGGEAQRIKLAAELIKRDTGRTLYVLDEPTTGLHFEDIQYLLRLLRRLVDRRNTVLVIEHNMEVIQSADWVIDLGPEGGDHGGELVAEGAPEALKCYKKSHTAEFLRKEIPSAKNTPA